jgi:adenosylcobinamide-GDP ribazoletransferase
VSAADLDADSPLRRELRALLSAVQYFTRVPVPAWVGHSAAQLARAARYFPLVGAAVGIAGAATLWLAVQVLPPLLAVVLSCMVTVALTGAFHEDGLADTFDGLGDGMGASASRERALEIMKDSRLGTFGTLALLLVVLLKIAALAALPTHLAMLALIAGHTWSRACAVALAWQLPYARTDASTRAKPVVEHVGVLDLSIAGGCGLAALLCVGTAAAGVAGVTLPVLWLLGRWFERRLGGYTGDTLGAAQQVCEVGCYIVLVAAWNSS